MMDFPQYQDEFDEEKLQITMNAHDWTYIDADLSQLPSNPVYQLKIQNKQNQKYYQRLRYILQKQQTHFMPLTLALTSYMLKCSTNNYYALMLRRKYVLNQISTSKDDAVNYILSRELKLMNNLLEDNPKEYHIWTYKKDLIQFIFTRKQQQKNQVLNHAQSPIMNSVYTTENQFIFTLLIEDCRNYHAWDYRFWLATFFNKINEEFNWIDQLIKQSEKKPLISQELKQQLQQQNIKAHQLKIDWLNVYSLWSHKLNLLKYSIKRKREQNIQKIILQEIEAVIRRIVDDKKNQCLWNYLKGLLSLWQCQIDVNHSLSQEIVNIIRKTIFRFENQADLEESLNSFNRFELLFLKRMLKYIEFIKDQNLLITLIDNTLKKLDPTRIKYYDYLLKQNSSN